MRGAERTRVGENLVGFVQSSHLRFRSSLVRMSLLGCLTVGSLDGFGVGVTRNSDDLRKGRKKEGRGQLRDEGEEKRKKGKADAPCSNPSPSTVSVDVEPSGDGWQPMKRKAAK